MFSEQYGRIREWLKSFTRDDSWPIVRNRFVERYPYCECCGTEEDINVHHIMPVKWFPELELIPYNLITLCRGHHFTYGHLRNWKKWNPMVWESTILYKEGYEEFEYIYEYVSSGKEIDYDKCIKELHSKARKRYDIRRQTKKIR